MKELFKYPSLVLSLAGAIGVFIGFGSAWATQISRIDVLEKNLSEAKERFANKDQLDTIRQLLEKLDEKIEIRLKAMDEKMELLYKKK